MPSNPKSDGETAAGLLAFYGTEASLPASRKKPWPLWVATLLDRKLRERLRSTRDPEKRANLRAARERVKDWKNPKPRKTPSRA
jgi:hypothetical protein